ncbi:hypothetical protein BACCAP_03629 [Pseudoflavonifractor capillosus ATCC 29799]|uniref:Uncharacterized protein n=1 Tax=Pseudoflavonifractor capillosus ATCC 29799 TaxID=411467 RepID=A6NZH8_9FIRM|nr:hypothetical protein BACCAP_03629 [Pseudoflavonifractor capillosus ATCC 29799]
MLEALYAHRRTFVNGYFSSIFFHARKKMIFADGMCYNGQD